MLRQVIAIVLTATFIFMATGCATILAKDQQIIHVTSNPPGAQISIDGYPMGATPAQVAVDSHTSHQITITMSGQPPITCFVQAGIGVIWVVLDIVFGFFPLIIDLVTGDWYELDRNFCSATFAGATTAPAPYPSGVGAPVPAPAPAPVPAPAPPPPGGM